MDVRLGSQFRGTVTRAATTASTHSRSEFAFGNGRHDSWAQSRVTEECLTGQPSVKRRLSARVARRPDQSRVRQAWPRAPSFRTRRSARRRRRSGSRPIRTPCYSRPSPTAKVVARLLRGLAPFVPAVQSTDARQGVRRAFDDPHRRARFGPSGGPRAGALGASPVAAVAEASVRWVFCCMSLLRGSSLLAAPFIPLRGAVQAFVG